MNRDQMQTAVILVNWNGWRDTVECVESLMLSTIPLLIVVVDNGSKDDSVLRLEEQLRDNIVLIQTGSNLGFGGGCNAGIRWAMEHTSCRWFWMLNNDTIVLPDSAELLVGAAERNPNWGIIGNSHADYYDRETLQVVGGGRFNRWTTGSFTYGEQVPVSQAKNFKPEQMVLDQIAGASFLLPRKVVEQVGYLNEELFLFFEEIDYANRVRKADYTLGVAPASLIYHKQGASTAAVKSRNRRTLLTDFYGIRNRILITRRYFPIALPVIYATLAVGCLKRLLSGRFRAVVQLVGVALFILKKPMKAGRE